MFPLIRESKKCAKLLELLAGAQQF